MPVTVRPAKHSASIESWPEGVEDAEHLLRNIRGVRGVETMIQSSFEDLKSRPPIHTNKNGFVSTAIQAYARHQHLIIRPEDVWFAILTQLSFYINHNAEELRGTFVSHQGKKKLEIVTGGTPETCHIGAFTAGMAKLIEQHLVDPTLRAWIQPHFTTTTEEDVTVASIIMMGIFKEYFRYGMGSICGLPSVTLLGQKGDWESILHRLDRIPHLGKEPARWYKLLVPIITHFIRCFEDPEDAEVVNFWQNIVYVGGVCGVTYYTGWITAFCFWSEKGDCSYTEESDEEPHDVGLIYAFDALGHWAPRLCLSGVLYQRITSYEVSPGYVSVPVQVDDNGHKYDAEIIGGSIGMQVTSSGEPVVADADEDETVDPASASTGDPLVGLDTVQPVSGWFMFKVDSEQAAGSPLETRWHSE